MTNPGDKTFLSGDNPLLEIVEVVTKLNAVFSISGNEVLNETYYPDANNKVKIRDLGKLSETYFVEPSLIGSSVLGAPLVISLKLTDDSGTVPISITIYPCDVETAGTLSIADLNAMPLSRVTGKNTYPGNKEFLGFYGTAQGRSIHAGIAYRYGKRVRFVRTELGKITGNVYKSLDVSPSVMVSLVAKSSNKHWIAEGDLFFYEIYDSQAFRYDVQMFVPDSLHTFLFRNCFHAAETFSCTGDLDHEKKWERSTGNVNNKTVLINRKLTDTKTVYTGYLEEQECGIVEDLINSTEVYLLTKSGWESVVIVGESFKITNRKDDVISASFEYRVSSNNHSQFRFVKRVQNASRIFDKTFDKTFN